MKFNVQMTINTVKPAAGYDIQMLKTSKDIEILLFTIKSGQGPRLRPVHKFVLNDWIIYCQKNCGKSIKAPLPASEV